MPFNLSFTHLMVVGIVALVVLGPDRLPGAARTAGNLYREWKRISSGLEAEVREVFSDFTEPFSEHVSGPIAEMRTTLSDTVQTVRGAAAGVTATIRGTAGGPAADDGAASAAPGARDGVGPAPSLGPPLGPGTGLVSPGPVVQFHLPELAPRPMPETFVPYTPGGAGGGGA